MNDDERDDGEQWGSELEALCAEQEEREAEQWENEYEAWCAEQEEREAETMNALLRALADGTVYDPREHHEVKRKH